MVGSRTTPSPLSSLLSHLSLPDALLLKIRLTMAESTLIFDNFSDGLAGYKVVIDPVIDKLKNSVGLMEGVTVIVLILLSYLTADFSWDYCLMLNSE